jgi:hypothetical protein
MQTLIVYLDDAAHALRQLQSGNCRPSGPEPVRWLLVGCAPRVTQMVSKWVTRSARESWRGKWADKLFSQIAPALQRPGDELISCVAMSNVSAHTDELLQQYPGARLLDFRRPRSVGSANPSTVSASEPPKMYTFLLTASAGFCALAE